MAERRMFSKKIVSSARFLRMPASSRELYFQLGINADDDGVVEAFTVMRQVGATEDDLHVLTGKQFIQVLNDDLVAYINDWQENNKIRADRKVDSIYRSLLIKVLPDVVLQASRSRKEISNNVNDNQVSTKGQPVASEKSAQVRLGKDRLGNNNVQISTSKLKSDFEKLWAFYPKGRKQGKNLAFKDYVKAIKSGETTNHKISVALSNYKKQIAQDDTPLHYVKLGGTWFHNKGWNDEYVVSSATNKLPVEESIKQQLADYGDDTDTILINLQQQGYKVTRKEIEDERNRE